MSSNTQANADDVVYPSTIPFVLVHLACIGVIWSGITWEALAICFALYWLRIFAIGAGYHRYFSHRAYSTSRAFQFILAVAAQTSAQKSVLWWAAMHRHHHLHSDTEHDSHSPRQHGFLYSHIGWIFARRNNSADLSKVADLVRFPELRFLHKFELLPAIALAGLCFFVAGWSGLVVGFVWSTVLVYHATFCINSLAHVSGSARYVTGDDSRNNFLLALFTMGEGWHNNHHAFQSSVRQGFRWWEIDPTYYLLWVLSCVGVVWDLKTPPERVLRNEQRLGSRVIHRAAEQLADRFSAERVAIAITSALQDPELSALKHLLSCAHVRASDALAAMRVPHLPSREEILHEARIMFRRTPSLEEIVDRAYELFIASVGSRLVIIGQGKEL
jgi:stearoyl-CoA desaturase (delta-9 desaturase)